MIPVLNCHQQELTDKQELKEVTENIVKLQENNPDKLDVLLEQISPEQFISISLKEALESDIAARVKFLGLFKNISQNTKLSLLNFYSAKPLSSMIANILKMPEDIVKHSIGENNRINIETLIQSKKMYNESNGTPIAQM